MTPILQPALAVLSALGILVIGCVYIAAPQKIAPSFGLKLPAPDLETRAWLRLKGIRDLASGMVVLTLLLTTNLRTVGIVLLVLAITPFGDMANVLVSGGRKVTAFSVHGLTCVAVLLTGLWLLHSH